MGHLVDRAPLPGEDFVGLAPLCAFMGCLPDKEERDVMLVFGREEVVRPGEKAQLVDGEARLFQHFAPRAFFRRFKVFQMASGQSPLAGAVRPLPLSDEKLALVHHEDADAYAWSIVLHNLIERADIEALNNAEQICFGDSKFVAS